MKESTLFKTLQALDKRELKLLDKFIKSGLINSTPKCYDLFVILCQHLSPKSKNITIDKEALFFTIFPEKKKYNSSLSVLMTQLQKQIENYFIWDNLQQNNSLKTLLLQPSRTRFKQQALYQKEVKDQLKRLHHKTKKDQDDFLYSFLLTNELQREKKLQDQEQIELNKLEALDNFYFGNRLKLSYELIQMYPSWTKQKEYIETILAHVEQYQDPLSNPTIFIYQFAIKHLKKENDDHSFEELMALIEQHQGQIEKKELNDIFKLAINYCVYNVYLGKVDYLQHLFSVYQKMVEYNALFIGQYIELSTIKNIVSLSCQLREFDWVDDFTNRYNYYLDPKYSEDVKLYNQGVIHFYKKEFQQAHDCFNTMYPINLVFELNRKFLLLKIFYELDEQIAFEAFTQSFSAFLRKNKVINSTQKKGYLNFIKILRQIQRLSFKKITEEQINRIANKILSAELLSDKKYLNEKLDAFKK